MQLWAYLLVSWIIRFIQSIFILLQTDFNLFSLFCFQFHFWYVFSTFFENRYDWFCAEKEKAVCLALLFHLVSGYENRIHRYLL